MSKKILAALLAVLMVVTMVPMAALAEELVPPEVPTDAPKIIAWGYSGSGATGLAENKAFFSALDGTVLTNNDYANQTLWVVLDKPAVAAEGHIYGLYVQPLNENGEYAGDSENAGTSKTDAFAQFQSSPPGAAISFLNDGQVTDALSKAGKVRFALGYGNTSSQLVGVVEGSWITLERGTENTVNLEADVTFKNPLVLSEGVTLNKNGHTVTYATPTKPNSITPAILHDTTGAVPDNAVNGSYSVNASGASNEELGCYVTDINISASMLKPQGNAQNPVVAAYWTGFAAVPDGSYTVTQMKVAQGTTITELNEAWSSATPGALQGAVASGKSGLARYYAADSAEALQEKFNGRLIRVQWYNGETAVGEAETYRLNFDNVRFDPNAVTISKVIVKNSAGTETVDTVTATASYDATTKGKVSLSGLMPGSTTTYTLDCTTSVGGNVKVQVVVTPGGQSATYSLTAVADSAVVKEDNLIFYVVNNEYSVDLSGLKSTDVTLAPPVASGEVTMPDASNEIKEAVANTMKQTEAAGLTALVVDKNPTVTTTETEGKNELDAKHIDTTTNSTITIVVQPFLKVDVTDYKPDAAAKELKVEISAHYREVAVATSSTFDEHTEVKVDGEVESGANAVTLGDPVPVAVDTPIELSVKLPTGFAEDDAELYVKHEKGGNTYYYKATVKSGSAVFTSTHGLSPFTIMADFTPAAQIGDTYYETLQAAVNAVENGQVIKLLANSAEEVKVNKEVSFTVDLNSFSASIAAGTGYTNNGTDNSYEIVRSGSTPVVPSNPGGSTGTSGNITVTKPANGSMTSNVSSAKEGDKVTVTVKPDAPYYIVTGVTAKGENGNVTVTKNADGTYSFTMPKGSVTVNATISHIYNLFKDVPTDIAEYGTAIKWAVEKGITLGTDTVAYSTFSPYNPCTRAQMVVFLYRAAGSPAVSGTNNFTDVPGDAEIQKAVQWAVSKGITKGTSDTTFDPYAPCTRGQMVTFLHRNHSEPAATGSNNFADVPADAFYKDAVQWAVNEGITKGTGDTTFAPNDACTRVQMVTFLYRDMGK